MKFILEPDEVKNVYYIKTVYGRTVNVRDLRTGADTGVKKSWHRYPAAKRMLDRLNNGEKPSTVYISEKR